MVTEEVVVTTVGDTIGPELEEGVVVVEPEELELTTVPELGVVTVVVVETEGLF